MKTVDVVEITNVDYIENYKLKLQFSDNSEKIIDFEPFLSKSHNPLTKKYFDESNFKKYKLEYGDLIWGDYELCFPIWDLYEGKIK